MWDTSQREPTIIKSMRKLITNVQKMRERAGDVVALSRAASEAQYEGDTLNYETLLYEARSANHLGNKNMAIYQVIEATFKNDHSILSNWLSINNMSNYDKNETAKYIGFFGNPELLEILLRDMEWDVNCPIEYGMTLLHITSGVSFCASLSVTNKFNSNIESFNASKWDFSTINSAKKIEILKSRGANLSAQDEDGNTPLHIAVFSSIAGFLSSNKDGNTSHSTRPAIFEIFEQLISPENVNLKNIDGKTPLHIAVVTTNLAIIQLFFDKGADISNIDIQGDTLFHTAAIHGTVEVLEYFFNTGRFNINERNLSDGCTPLHVAASNGKVANVEFLIKHGADTNAVRYDGQTPLQRAEANNRLEVVEFFKTLHANTDFTLAEDLDANKEDIGIQHQEVNSLQDDIMMSGESTGIEM